MSRVEQLSGRLHRSLSESQRQLVAAKLTTVEHGGDRQSANVRLEVSLNLHRRHLTESQRGMVAANIENMPTHRPADKDANLHTSQAQAAKLMNVSERPGHRFHLAAAMSAGA
jgi:hypothetical protein